jgi:hypothetical protein
VTVVGESVLCGLDWRSLVVMISVTEIIEVVERLVITVLVVEVEMLVVEEIARAAVEELV